MALQKNIKEVESTEAGFIANASAKNDGFLTDVIGYPMIKKRGNDYDYWFPEKSRDELGTYTYYDKTVKDLTALNDCIVQRRLSSYGDADTYLDFSTDDQVVLNVGGVPFLTVVESDSAAIGTLGGNLALGANYLNYDGSAGKGIRFTMDNQLVVYNAGETDTFIQVANDVTGSEAGDGLIVGVEADGDAVLRVDYMRYLKFQRESLTGPIDMATLSDTGTIRFNVNGEIECDELYINNLPAKSDPATTVLVPGPDGCVSTRTVAQIRSDIGAASADHVHAIADITNLQTTLNAKQPVHANLTSISNLSTTPSGRFLVTNGSEIVARSLQNSDLPAIAITDTFVVSSQAAMLALSAAERGDVAVRTDLNKSFILKGDNPASLSDWQELLTPTDAVLSVDGRTGVVSLSDKYQPLDTNLTAIAGLTHSNRHVLISDGSTWTRRALVAEDIPNLSAAKITSGTLDNARLSFNPDYFVQGNSSSRTTDAGSTDVNSFLQSGFYRATSTAPNLPTANNYGIIHTNHNASTPNAFQLASLWSVNQLYYRTKQNDTWQPWVELYHSGNAARILNQDPIAGTITPDKYIIINCNGTDYKIPVVAA